MTLPQYVEETKGKGIDFDGAFGSQCVDLARDYCKRVLNVTLSPPVKSAKDIWNTYNKLAFWRIENTPQAIVQAGDIVIWGGSYGEHGHIAIATKGTQKRFEALSQNDPIGTKTHIRSYTYNHVLGWLRLKGMNEDTMQAELDNMRKQRDDNWNRGETFRQELEKALDELKSSRAQLDSVKKDRNKLVVERDELTELVDMQVKEISQLTGKNNALNEQITTLIEKGATMPSTQFKLNQDDLKSVGRGAVIALAGALIVFLTDVVAGLNFGAFTPFAVALSAVVVNFLRKWVAENK